MKSPLPIYNDSNFRTLLKMRVSCEDKNLTYHIENQALNTTYINPIIQNNFYKYIWKNYTRPISLQNPTALYVHCSAHSLKLAFAHLSNIHHIRNLIGIIKSVKNVIKISTKLTELLKSKIKVFLPQIKLTKLTSMCEIKWVKNHDDMLSFSEIYKPIVATLEELLVQ
jgi:hypothetical protein|uniref:Zinc finger MYM-type protein 1-like n=1 Tax=Sipha flava TaxID=143950 RepID=A0A2S2QPK1_9HEMI